MQIRHKKRLEIDGPVIVVSNHISNLDPPTVASVLPRKPLFMAKRELFGNALFSFLLKGWGAFPVNRYSADLKALNWAVSMLKHQRLIVLFPEGTRTRDNSGLKQGQIGAALIAAKSEATVVPLAIQGTEGMQSFLRVLMPKSKIRISIGEPFKVNLSSNDRHTLKSATDEIMTRIAMQLPEERRGIYKDKISCNFIHTSTINNTNMNVTAKTNSTIAPEGRS